MQRQRVRNSSPYDLAPLLFVDAAGFVGRSLAVHGFTVLSRPTTGVVWAGTELATSWNGYIEGALDVMHAHNPSSITTST